MSPEASCHQSNDDSSIVGSFHEPENARLDSEGLTRFRFMVPMHAEKNRKGALHEPWMCRADIAVCRFGRLSIRPKQKHGTGMSREPAGWKACATDWRGFMVPMHAKKRKGAFQEPGRHPCPNPFAFGVVAMCRSV